MFLFLFSFLVLLSIRLTYKTIIDLWCQLSVNDPTTPLKYCVNSGNPIEIFAPVPHNPSEGTLLKTKKFPTEFPY